MRRKTRRAVVNAVFFASALTFVLYLNLGGSINRTFSWTSIRYQTPSKSTPPARGKCPGLADTEKPTLVVSRVEADGSPNWLASLSKKYHMCIYTNDASADSDTLRVPANRGNEAMAYLTFIIDNYAYISVAGAVFVHGSRWAWHNDSPDYDNLALLEALNTSRALEITGYHNLRCDWSAGTCDSSSTEFAAPGSLETRMRAVVEPYNKRAVSDAALPAAFARIFGGEGTEDQVMLGRYDFLRAQCCAQFIVARRRIWQYSREEYIALRQWLLDKDAAPSDDKVAGRILSYLWHVLFLPRDGEYSVLDRSNNAFDLHASNNLACPSAQECYCRLYGRCKLQCSTQGACEGQYVLPKDYKLPKDWATTHS